MNRIDFSFALGRVRIDLAPPEIRAGAATHRVDLPVTVQASWLDPEVVADTATLLVEGFVWAGSTMKPVQAVDAVVWTLRGYATTERLVLSVSDEQLYALEILRGLDTLRLLIDLKGTLLGADPAIHPTSEVQVGYDIARSRWLELLDQVGAELGITVRVPSPLTDAGILDCRPTPDDAPSLRQAGERLRQARGALRDGDYERCIQLCRSVLENVGKLAPPPSANSVFGTASRERDQVQRWAAIHHDVVNLTNASHHDDAITASFSWSRLDAEAVLALTAGLLVRQRR